MKVYYSGFNGFGQLSGKHGELSATIINREDVCIPEEIYECSSSEHPNLYLGWSRIIISTEENVSVRGFWDGTSDFNGSISPNFKANQVACTDTVAVAIDGSGSLRRMSLQTAQPFWENVIIEDSLDAGKVRFTKLATNDHTVLGLDHSASIYMLPTKLDIKQTFADVCCGKEHFMALSTDGAVFTWGVGSRGQLGHGDVQSIDQPEEVEALGGVRIVQIAAGGWHSCALSEAGDLYVWGWNESGQLGLPCRNLSGSASASGEYVSVQSEPRLLDCAIPFTESDTNVTSVACGARHTAATLGDKSGWSWGWNGNGQLGSGDRRSRDAPVRVIQDVDKVMCAAWSTAWLSGSH